MDRQACTGRLADPESADGNQIQGWFVNFEAGDADFELEAVAPLLASSSYAWEWTSHWRPEVSELGPVFEPYDSFGAGSTAVVGLALIGCGEPANPLRRRLYLLAPSGHGACD